MPTCKPIPDGYHSVTPYLATTRVAEVVDFLVSAFDAKEGHRSARADGSVMHTDVVVGDSHVMLGEPQGDDFPAMPSNIYLYVEDSDAMYQRAVDAGGEVVMPLQTLHSSGQRYGGVRDPGLIAQSSNDCPNPDW